MRLYGVFAATAAALLMSASNAQIPAARDENCGAILSSVISVCSHPTLSRPDWCCNELKRWNDARCWCEPNAFDALDTVAATGYAYSFRQDYCEEEFQRPNRGRVTPEQANCEPFDSVPDSDDMEQCPDGSPAELRLQRSAALDALRDDKVASPDELSAWFMRMDELFTEDASYENIGLFLGQGRFEVKQYLMTRQEVYGFMPATADMTDEHFWRSPNMVSYKGGLTTSNGFFGKHEFVTFERCSARIVAVYTLDDNYQTRYGQIWDASTTRLMLRYNTTAENWCAQVAERCADDTYPFESDADCTAFYDSLVESGQVTCNRFQQAYVPQYAVHGDTLACRSFYLDLAVVDAGGACPAVGKEPNQGRCAEPQCPGNSFMDPFAREASEPQFETPMFECSETSCSEDWPSEAQVAAVPEGEERTGEDLEIAPTEPEDPVLATDADTLIDEEFENTDVPVAGPPAEPDSEFSIGSLNSPEEEA